MNKKSTKVSKVVADMALRFTKVNVNTFCPLFSYQPQMPKGYEKLNRK